MGKIVKIPWKKGQNMEEWSVQRGIMEGVGTKETVRIGASDIGTITGSNKWKCPQRLFYHLTGFHQSPAWMTEATVAGHLMEPIIQQRWESWDEDEQVALYNTLNKIKVRKVKSANFFLTNSDYPHLFSSLDYIPVGKSFSPWTGERYKPLTPNEFKHTNSGFYRLWPNGIAQQYLEQVHQQMMVSNTQVCVFHVLVDGVKYYVKEIERDEELCKFIDFKVNEFCENVLIGRAILKAMNETSDEEEKGEYMLMFERISPPPVGSDDQLELYGEMWPDSDDLIKQGDLTDEFHMNQYLKCTKVVNNIEAHKKLMRARLLESCKDFAGIEVGERKMVNRRAVGNKRAYFGIR